MNREKPSGARRRVTVHAHLLVAAAVTTLPVVGGCGYDVVDPIPPPANCPDLVDDLVVSAQWVDNGAGSTVVEIVISAPADRPDVQFRADVSSLTGATLVAVQGGATLTVRIAPDGSTQPGFVILLDCKTSKPTDPMRVHVALTTATTAPAGTAVSVSLSETF